MRTILSICAVAFLFGSTIQHLFAADWSGFRGPNSSGVSSETNLPATWSNDKNLHWKTSLPGGGSSGPITVGDKVFVTCYSGYGDGGEDQKKLLRHVVCLEQKSGSILWEKTVKPVLPEDPYSGLGVPSHGYASSTPVSDGRIYLRSFIFLYCVGKQ